MSERDTKSKEAERPRGGGFGPGGGHMRGPVQKSKNFSASGKRLLGCILGGSNSLREIPRLVALWQGGRLDLGSLITQRRPLAEINAAFDELRASRGIRTVLTC